MLGRQLGLKDSNISFANRDRCDTFAVIVDQTVEWAGSRLPGMILELLGTSKGSRRMPLGRH